MRRVLWMGLGVAAGAAGPRWAAGAVRRRAVGRRAERGMPRPAHAEVHRDGSAGTPAVGAPAVGAPVVDVVGPAVASAGAAVGRVASRLAARGARRVGGRVQRAVAGGRADAAAREQALRVTLAVRRPPAGAGELERGR